MKPQTCFDRIDWIKTLHLQFPDEIENTLSRFAALLPSSPF